MAGAASRAETIAPDADVTLLLRRAESGDARAAFLLGMRYARPDDASRDDAEAVRWLRQAAEQGLAEAQYNLGIMYASGRGVARDYVQAYKWFSLADQAGHSPSAARYRDRAASFLEPDEIAEANRQAHEWLAARRAR